MGKLKKKKQRIILFQFNANDIYWRRIHNLFNRHRSRMKRAIASRLCSVLFADIFQIEKWYVFFSTYNEKWSNILQNTTKKNQNQFVWSSKNSKKSTQKKVNSQTWLIFKNYKKKMQEKDCRMRTNGIYGHKIEEYLPYTKKRRSRVPFVLISFKLFIILEGKKHWHSLWLSTVVSYFSFRLPKYNMSSAVSTKHKFDITFIFLSSYFSLVFMLSG